MALTRQPSREERERALKKAQDEYRERMRKLAVALVTGSILLMRWREEMRREIRALHLLVAVLAGGDIERDAELRQRVLSEVDRQLRYLERWVTQLIPQELTQEQVDKIATRAAMYGTATRQTFFLSYTRSLGLPFMPFYPKDRTVCKVGCNCGWRIVQLKGRGNFDCFWRLGIAEHCPTCLARERACSPLRVRGGVIVDPQRYQAVELYA